MADGPATGVASAEGREASGRAGVLGADATAGRNGERGDECAEGEADEAAGAESEPERGHGDAASGEDAGFRAGLDGRGAFRRVAQLRTRAAGAGAQYGDTARGAEEVQAHQIRRDDHGARGADARH